MVADALAREITSLAGDTARVDVLDAHSFGPARFAGIPDDTLWSPETVGGVVRVFSTWALPRAYRRFAEKLVETKPLAVVCTHPLPAFVAAAAVASGRLKTTVVAVSANYGTPGAWPRTDVSLYCAADDRSADELVSNRGQREDTVAVTGIPVRAQFTLEYDLAAAREHFDLPHVKRLILALAGSTLPGPYSQFKDALAVSLPALASIPDTAVVVVTGRDDEFAEDLKSRSAAFGVGNVHTLGFVEHMAPLMAVADVALAIPGGVVCAECAAMGLPVVLMGPATGHERINADVLVEAGAALFARDPRTIAEYTRKAISSTSRLKRMSEAATTISRPFAATDVAERVLTLVGVPFGEPE
jgi:processive 1,2-diacylglycerol beta-glucosyltransferase